MGRLVNRVGQRFGKLVVLSQAGRNKLKKVLWRCQCDCGKEVIVVAGSLVTGNTTSCGCHLLAIITKHGGAKKASYNTWRAMMRRCYKIQDKDYSRYGAVGVRVCDQWHSYENFVADMGEPIGDETLDRIDTYGDYNKQNCRWAGVMTQNRNIRVRKNSKTGVIGVSKTASGTFMAKITCGKRAYYSKVYETVEEAAAARKELERIHWGVK